MPRSIFFRSIMRVPSVLSLIGYVMLKSKFSAFRNVFGNVGGQSVKNTILTNVVLCVCKYMYIWIYFFLFYSRPFEPIAASILPLCPTMNFLHSQFLGAVSAIPPSPRTILSVLLFYLACPSACVLRSSCPKFKSLAFHNTSSLPSGSSSVSLGPRSLFSPSRVP